ncbi:MAG: hypothetical protein JNM70_13830 [Anaerolineae bacterium]|nr:hypothetical protein [Anaerolineae bacterium]
MDTPNIITDFLAEAWLLLVSIESTDLTVTLLCMGAFLLPTLVFVLVGFKKFIELKARNQVWESANQGQMPPPTVAIQAAPPTMMQQNNWAALGSGCLFGMFIAAVGVGVIVLFFLNRV